MDEPELELELELEEEVDSPGCAKFRSFLFKEDENPAFRNSASHWRIIFTTDLAFSVCKFPEFTILRNCVQNPPLDIFLPHFERALSTTWWRILR